MRRKRCAAAWAVRNYLEALVKQALFVYLLQSPPFRLYKVVVIGNIRVFHVSPEANSAGEVLPHTLVFPYRLFTLLDERLKTVFLDLLLAVKTKHFLYFKLNRQTMCVPASLTRNLIAFHSTVSWYHILDSTSQNVTDMRLAVSRWRSVIENIGLALFTAVNTFFKDIVIVPELFHFFFSLNEVQIGVNLFVHEDQSFLIL